METLHIVKLLLLVIFYFALSYSLELRPMSDHSEMCKIQSKDPYFDIQQAVGATWRIYYTWNVQMDNKCLDLNVRNATPSITNRINGDMSVYLETQPEWDAATLYLTMGTAKHELLLFVDQGPEGSFLGVPNVIRDGNITPGRYSVPLLKFFLKLLHGGKYLLMMDCHIGVSSLMSRERPPYAAEVAAVAKALNIGDGSLACSFEGKSGQEVSV